MAPAWPHCPPPLVGRFCWPAVADAGDWAVLRVATAQVPAADWLPAEEAGLVSVDRRRPVPASSGAGRGLPGRLGRSSGERPPGRRRPPDGLPRPARLAPRRDLGLTRRGRRGLAGGERAPEQPPRCLHRGLPARSNVLPSSARTPTPGRIVWCGPPKPRCRPATQPGCGSSPPRVNESTRGSGAAEAQRTARSRRTGNDPRPRSRAAGAAPQHRISLTEDPLLALSALTTTALVAQFTGEESTPPGGGGPRARPRPFARRVTLPKRSP